MRLAATDDGALPFFCRIIVQKKLMSSQKNELLPIDLALDGTVFRT
jgi:hypothetical protein